MSGRFSIVPHTLRSKVEKPKNTGFWTKFQPTGPCNSGTDSQIDKRNGSLDARERVGWDAALVDCVVTMAAAELGKN